MKSRINRSRPRVRRAFTLIELLLVLVILGVLAAIVVPKFANRGEDARRTAARAQIAEIETVLGTFEVDNGRYPTTDEGLAALVQPPPNAKVKTQYLPRIPTDPWGNEYVYRCPGQRNAAGYDLFSRGADGQEGGADDIDSSTK